MLKEKVYGWHITNEPVPDGTIETCEEGPILVGVRGLHFSENLLDAVYGAPLFSTVICFVEASGDVSEPGPQRVCRQRKVLWCVPGEEIFQKFSLFAALTVLSWWNEKGGAPQEVFMYLNGDESLRKVASELSLLKATESFTFVMIDDDMELLEYEKKPENRIKWAGNWVAWAVYYTTGSYPLWNAVYASRAALMAHKAVGGPSYPGGEEKQFTHVLERMATDKREQIVRKSQGVI